MLTKKSTIKVRTKKESNFIDDFCKSFGEVVDRKFTNVYVGSDKVEIENSSLSFLVIWNLYELITSGKVTTKKRNSLVTISCEANFSNFIIFWSMMTAIIIIGEAFYGFEDKIVFFLPVLWGGYGFLLIQFSYMKFRSRVVESIEKSKGTIL